MIFKKLEAKWKKQWLDKRLSEIESEHQSFIMDLESKHEKEVERVKEAWSIELEICKVRTESNISKLKNDLDIKMENEKLSLEKIREKFLQDIKSEIESLGKQRDEIKSLKNSLLNESLELKSSSLRLKESHSKEISNLEESFQTKKTLILARMTSETKYLNEKEDNYKNHKREVEALSIDLVNEHNKLNQEYSALTEEFESKKSTLSKKIELMEFELEVRNEEVKTLLDRAVSKEQELRIVNEDLNLKIKTLEAKASPNSVWLEAFTQGFSKAWDSMNPLMMESVHKSKKAIEENAIMETIKRNSNGHYKTIN